MRKPEYDPILDKAGLAVVSPTSLRVNPSDARQWEMKLAYKAVEAPRAFLIVWLPRDWEPGNLTDRFLTKWDRTAESLTREEAESRLRSCLGKPRIARLYLNYRDYWDIDLDEEPPKLGPAVRLESPIARLSKGLNPSQIYSEAEIRLILGKEFDLTTAMTLIGWEKTLQGLWWAPEPEPFHLKFEEEAQPVPKLVRR